MECRECPDCITIMHPAGGLLCWECNTKEQLTAKMEVYNISKNRWSVLPDMSTPRQNPLVSIMGNSIYVIGGMDSTKVISSFEVFDIQSRTWEKRADIPEPGVFSGSVTYRNKIFILDGAEKRPKATPLPNPVKLAVYYQWEQIICRWWM